MKVTTILGTRPEIIKLSPLIPLLQKEFEHKLIHTGQHYDYEMDRVFFRELDLPSPDVELSVGSDTQARQTAKIISGVEEELIRNRPGLVIVQGDTNSTMGGALAASKLNIPIAHVEAGARSFNKQMPEEINRIIADHLSTYLFAMDKTGQENLLNEGIKKNNIYAVGNTGIDAFSRNIAFADAKKLGNLGIEGEFVLATVHRAENTSSKEILSEILNGLDEIGKEIKVVLPLHPRVKANMESFGLSMPKHIFCLPPLGYLDFLALERDSKLILTDSGGVQEEAALLDVPCVVLRSDTEYTELEQRGKIILAGNKHETIARVAKRILSNKIVYERMQKSPSGLIGGASEKIIRVLA